MPDYINNGFAEAMRRKALDDAIAKAAPSFSVPDAGTSGQGQPMTGKPEILDRQMRRDLPSMVPPTGGGQPGLDLRAEAQGQPRVTTRSSLNNYSPPLDPMSQAQATDAPAAAPSSAIESKAQRGAGCLSSFTRRV
jgi:hypothetical protein